MEIKHIIYTRFSNVAFGFTDEELLNENRLEKKLEIFLKKTYQSMINQTNLNFEWVILVHDNIPKKIYDRLIDLNKLIVVKNSEVGNIVNWTFNYFDLSNIDYIITSRLDDDDLLHVNAINQIQQSINNETLLKVFGFNNGCSFYENKYFEMSPDYKGLGFIALGMSLIYNYKIYNKIKLTVLNMGGMHVNFKQTLIDNWIPKFNEIKSINDDYLKSENFWMDKTNKFPSYIYNRNDYSDSKRKMKDNFKPHFSNFEVGEDIIKKHFKFL
jgi:hypothetical protein